MGTNRNFVKVFVLFLLGIGLGCSPEKKKGITKFEDIRPKHANKTQANQSNEDTLSAYLNPFNQEKVSLNFDSIYLNNEIHFLDRFIDKSNQGLNHFILKKNNSECRFGQWKFKDSTARKNALFNWLDHFGPSSVQVELNSKKNICNAHLLILINKKSIIEIISPQPIEIKKWIDFQRITDPKDSLVLRIEQRKGKSCQWVYGYSQ